MLQNEADSTLNHSVGEKVTTFANTVKVSSNRVPKQFSRQNETKHAVRLKTIMRKIYGYKCSHL